MAAIDDLMSALSENAALQQSMTNATTPEEAVKAAAAAGYKVTSQELLEAYKSKMGAMSEDELSSVAGGKGDTHQNNYNSHGNHGGSGGDPTNHSNVGPG